MGNKEKMEKQFLTTAEYAAILDVNEETVRRNCLKGKIPGAFQPFGEGGPWRIPFSAVNGGGDN